MLYAIKTMLKVREAGEQEERIRTVEAAVHEWKNQAESALLFGFFVVVVGFGCWGYGFFAPPLSRFFTGGGAGRSFGVRFRYKSGSSGPDFSRGKF